MYNHDHENEIIPFAYTSFRKKNIRFGIKTDDRRRHIYIIGKTGMGKSELLKHLIYADIQSGHGVCVVDPHGEAVEDIINYIPTQRINDVIFFNPADINYPIAFNILEKVPSEYRHLVASGIVGVFKKLWAETWGPRLEYVLRNAVLALLEYPNSTLLGIMRILVDKEYRKKVIEKVKDPVVRSFWINEYSKYPDRFQTEAIAPIQNKVGAFLSTSLIRNIIGQVKSTIDLRDVMDNSKILLLDLSKGRIGEDASSLLGALMITKIQLAAMSRVDIPEKERRDFYLYVDEFQNFATESFANILSEARKYHLNLTIAHQYIEQLDEKVQAAVFGNVGTIVVFRVGAADAEILVKEFTPFFTEEDLVNIPKFNIYLKLMIDGISSDPFSASTFPPLSENQNTGNLEKIIRVSRERYAKKREVIEDKIARWMGDVKAEHSNKKQKRASDINLDKKSENGTKALKKTSQVATTSKTVQKEEDDNSVVQKKEDKNEKVEKTPVTDNRHDAICSLCKSPTKVSFIPDGVRPVYCKKCLKLEKRKRKLNKQFALLQKQEGGQSIGSKAAGLGADDENLETPKEISLQDAIKQEPVSFNQARRDASDTSQLNSSNKQRESNYGASNQQSSKSSQLKPGQVVKL